MSTNVNVAAGKTISFKPMNLGRVFVWSAFSLFVLCAPLLASSSFALTLLCAMGIGAIACLSYNMLLGQTGMLSFGHAVYTGLGAFIAAHLMNKIGAGLWLPMWAVPLVSGFVGLIFGALLGYITTRKSGTAFAMITMGIGELVFAAALMFPGFFGGEGGIAANRTAGEGWLKSMGVNFGSQIQVYYLIAIYFLISTALMYAFTQTPLGRMANAVRDNPERVSFLGYDARLVRYLVLMASSFFAGIAGGLTAINVEVATADLLHGTSSGAFLLFTFLGGTMFFFGPILGAVLLVFSLVVLSEWTKAWQLYVGVAFLIMVVFAPGGFSAIIMLNLRRIKFGVWRELRGPYLGLLVFGAATLFGLAALIEMTYQLKVVAGSGSVVKVVGVVFDSLAGMSWIQAGIVFAIGAVGLEFWRRKFMRAWEAGEIHIAETMKKADAAIL